jgi:hypothetical protein
MIDIEDLRIRLAEAILWCTGHLSPDDPATSLRSSILRPPRLTAPDSVKIGSEEIVNTVARRRANLVSNQDRIRVNPARDLAGGRLLFCTSATESIPDGYVSTASEGFYDEDDLPPWDTWLYYIVPDMEIVGGAYAPECLVSWVPAAWIDLAMIGVKEHFLDCMQWAEQIDIPLTRQLRSGGLLS